MAYLACLAAAPLPAQELLRAAREGETSRVRSALASGSDVNETDREGWTALMLAALRNNPEIAEVLIRAGSNVNYREPTGMSALTIAKEAAAEQIVSLLRAAGASENLEERLDEAIRGNDLAQVRVLIDEGADVDVLETGSYQTPLMVALELGHLDVFLALVEAGASPMVEGTGIETTGESALRLAARIGSPWAFRLLAGKGVGRAQLEDALLAGCVHESIVRIALENGARPNARGTKEETALLCAASKGSRAAVEYLLEAGADPGLASNEGATALTAAKANGHVEVVSLLEETGQ